MQVLAVGNVLGFVAVLIVNYLAVSIPIGGMTTGQLADLYPNLFTPAAITFSIWGVIYLFLGAFVIWQLVDFYKAKTNNITKKIWIWFLLSCATNIWRMFARQYRQVFISVVIIIFFLLFLGVIAHRVELGKKLGSLWDKWFVQVPFSLYLGRLSVAVIANISALLVFARWWAFGISPIVRTIIVILIATLLTLRNLYKKSNIIFAFVVIRALLGIIIKRLAVDAFYTHNIIWTLAICIAVISAGIWRRFEQWRKN